MWKAAPFMLTGALAFAAGAHVIPDIPPPPTVCPEPEPVPEPPAPDDWKPAVLWFLDSTDRSAPGSFDAARYQGRGSGPSIDDVLREEGIVSLSPHLYLVSEALVAETLSDPQTLHASARVVPYLREGTHQGYRLSAIRRGSLLYRLGLRNGDVIQQVSDTPLRATSDAFAVYSSAQGTDTVTARILRKGQPTMMLWRLAR